jgi:hypothetical protein
MRRVFALLGLSAALVVAWLSLLPSQAVATVEGPCTASIDNVNVTKGHDDPGERRAVAVGERDPGRGTARRGDGPVLHRPRRRRRCPGWIRRHRAGRAQLGGHGPILDKISNATVGLFEVTAEVQTTGAPCTGTAYVCIEGRSPFTTAAGPARPCSASAARSFWCSRSPGRAGWGWPGRRSRVRGRGDRRPRGAVLLQQFCTLPLTAASAVGVPAVLGGCRSDRRVGVATCGNPRRAPRGADRPRPRGRWASMGPSGEPTEVIHHGAGAGHTSRSAPDTLRAPPRRAREAAGGPGGGGAGGGGPSPAPPGPGPGPPAGGGPSPAPAGPRGPAPGGGPSPAPAGPGGLRRRRTQPGPPWPRRTGTGWRTRSGSSRPRRSGGRRSVAASTSPALGCGGSARRSVRPG